MATKIIETTIEYEEKDLQNIFETMYDEITYSNDKNCNNLSREDYEFYFDRIVQDCFWGSYYQTFANTAEVFWEDWQKFIENNITKEFKCVCIVTTTIPARTVKEAEEKFEQNIEENWYYLYKDAKIKIKEV